MDTRKLEKAAIKLGYHKALNDVNTIVATGESKFITEMLLRTFDVDKFHNELNKKKESI